MRGVGAAATREREGAWVRGAVACCMWARGAARPYSADVSSTGRMASAPASHLAKAPSDLGLGYVSPDLRGSGYIGQVSGSQVDNLLGGRRARGLCSPRRSHGSNPLIWE